MKSILTGFGKISAVFAFVALLAFGANAQLSLRKALDVDGDNKADYWVFRPSSATWYILKNTGGSDFIGQAFGIANEDYMTPGDYDGDGKGDIAVFRDTNGTWYWWNSSTNTLSGAAFGSPGDQPIARDYDGDGKTDLAVVRRSNGLMYWYILGSTVGFYGQQFGISADYTAPGDYDGDGKFDIGVQRLGATATSQATFFYLRSSDGAVVGVPWGTSSDFVVPGDYDGDGKTDIAVVREGATSASPLVWFIQKSSDGGFLAYTFGLTGDDLNTQNDYDGDGKTDVSVWRNSTGTFYVLQSSNGGATGVNWGVTNDFPVASYDTH